MATVQTEVAAGGGHASTGRWGGRLLLIGLVVVTLFGAVLALQVSRSSDDGGRTGAQAEPVYLHGRNLRGLDPLPPVYLHGRNLRGLDPLPPVHGRNLRGLDPLPPVHGRNLRGLDPLTED